jgi:hypothetical protein
MTTPSFEGQAGGYAHSMYLFVTCPSRSKLAKFVAPHDLANLPFQLLVLEELS